MTTQYFDGLGRPIQTVVKGVTPLGKDLVTPVVYDEFGREQFKYLPFAANNTGGNSSITDGLFKLNPFQQDSAFYSNTNTVSPIKGQGETYFYGQTVFEASPLNRVLNTYPPGNNWVGNAVGIGQQYLTNTANDSVRIWSAGANPSDVPTTSATYDAGELYKNVTTDENGKQVVEYKDKEGKIVLKKVQLAGSPGTAHVGWLCTYFVYDDLNNLRFVLQPKGVETLLTNGNWTITSTIRDELCFYYGYDARNRMATKKVPGAGEVWMVYDLRDRLTYTQDANMRAKNWWLTTVYDGLNRPVVTAMMTYTGTRSQLESFAADANNLSGTSTVTVQGSNASANLGFSIRENGRATYQASESIEFRPGFESETDAEFTAEIVTTAGSSSSFTVTGNSFPSGATYKALTITNYDDYSGTSKTYSTVNNSKLTTNASFAETLPATASQQTKGMVTSTKVWVMEDAGLATGKWLETVNFYDQKGRVIQTISDNVADGKDTLTMRYDFSNKVVCSYLAHKNPGGNITNIQVRTNNNYDVAGRIISIEKRINGNATTDETVAQMSYDEIGQLKKKVFGSELDSMEYDYNIRGWMLGANRDYAKSTSSTTHYFGFDLGYDKQTIAPTGGSSIGTFTANQLNGNITGMLWKSTGDHAIRKYDFTYDAVNRLTGADFNQYTSSSFNKTAGIDFSVSNLAYDGNGNILSMTQKGWKVTGSDAIDRLAYGYNATSNKLHYVMDSANDANSKLGDFKETNNNTSQDYSYDANGNMYIDNNKAIGNIQYNHLNLPDSITITGKGTIEYVYDATGNKLKKITKEGSKVTTTLYLFGSYVNDTLQFMAHEEGRTRYISENATFAHDYFLKDHLGNVRMVLTNEKDTAFYPVVAFEDASTANEQVYYEKAADQRTTRPGPFYSNGTNGDKAQLLRKNVQSVGAGKLLKVMAKDRLHVKVDYYTPDETTNNSNANGLNAILTVLADLINSNPVTGSFHSSGSLITGNLNSSIPFTDFLAPQGSGQSSSMPKAYLNILFFDEQFKFVEQNSEIVQITTKGSGQTIYRVDGNAKEANKNGYAYIYVSNESENLVYFDNLQVTHERGPITEETHYYPFGLTMAGISSKAMGRPENQYKFNDGTELNTSLDVSLYETDFRLYDPQIGRFLQVDQLSEEFIEWSPFAYSINNPILVNDPTGLDTLTRKTNLDPVIVTGKRSNDRGIEYLNRLAKKDPMMAASQGYGYAYSLTPDQYHKAIGTTKEELEAYHKLSQEAALMLVPLGRLLKAGKLIYQLAKARQVLSIARFAYAGRFNIRTYKVLTGINNIAGTEVHHLIEKRFASLFNIKSDDMLSIVLTKQEHQMFTNAWRAEIGYEGSNATITTLQATRTQVEDAAKRIYANYPDILNALGL